MLQFRLNFNCGNSSVVEHNLAMVGVASSTLVSRSLFLLIFLFSTAFSITLKEALQDELIERIPPIQIDTITILPPQNLPDDYQSYTLKLLQITNLREFGGSARASFLDTNNRPKAIVFKFELDAKVSVYAAARDIKRGEIIAGIDFIKEDIAPSKYSDDLLLSDPTGLESKANIRNGELLKERIFVKPKDVKKGDNLILEVVDGGVLLSLSAVAISEANIGDMIEIKANNMRYKAKLISKNKAVIR